MTGDESVNIERTATKGPGIMGDLSYLLCPGFIGISGDRDNGAIGRTQLA